MPIRLPDPFTHPGLAPGFLSAPLVDNEPILQDELPNGEVLEVSTSTQFWSLNITYPDLLEDEYRLISSTINLAKSTDGIIQVALPQYLNLRVLGDGNTASIASGQAGHEIKITNISGLTGRPYVGDLFQLAGKPKVYKITAVTISGDTMTLGIYPNLAATTDGNEKPEFNNILFNMKLRNRNGISENLNADGLYQDVNISLREAL